MATDSFTSIQQTFSRKFGSVSAGGVIDPYITGYMFVKFAVIPKATLSMYSSLYSNSIPEDQMKDVLAASCNNVSIPGVTLNTTELNGLGGIRHIYPTSGNFDTRFSMRFFEHSGLPIQKFFHSWVRTIRDYRTGTSIIFQNPTGGNAYGKSNYAGALYYWTTAPDGITVEYYACLTGIFPLKDPVDSFSHDIAANDRLEIDIDFATDYLWHEPWVKDQCTALAKTYSGKGIPIIAGYGQQDSGASGGSL